MKPEVKDTIEKILTYTVTKDDDEISILSKQIICLKEAVMLYDLLFDNLKKAILETREECQKRWKVQDHNAGELTNGINHILSRLRALEESNE